MLRKKTASFHTVLLRCVALFIPGLLLVFLTSEISQEKLKKKSHNFDHCSTFIVSTQKDLYPVSLYLTSKINSGMNELSSSTALHSLPVQVKIM